MFKFCNKCSTKIGFKHKFKIWNKSTYKGYICEDCKTKYKPTKLSMIVDFIIVCSTYIIVFMFELYLKIGFILCFILLIIFNLAIPAIVIRYKAIE